MHDSHTQWDSRHQWNDEHRQELLEDTTVKPPARAAPAAALPVSTKPEGLLTHLPSKAGVWQRNYSPPTTTPTVAATAVSTYSAPTALPIGNVVYQALQAPKLLRGGEWRLSVANMLVASAFGLMFILTWRWPWLLGAAFFAWPVQWVIRMIARHDPNFWDVYFRARKQPLIREPHGYASDRQPKPLPIIPKPGILTK